MRVLTLAVDQYDSEGACVQWTLAARAVDADLEATELLELLLGQADLPLRQLTYDEVVDHLAARKSTSPDPWEQLSIF